MSEKDKRKVSSMIEEVLMYFSKISYFALRFSTPVLVPRVLYAALSDKKVNRESRSVDRECRRTTARRRKPERFSSVHGDICIPSIAFEEMFIASSSIKRISFCQRAIFLSTCAKSRPAFFVISGSG